MPVSSIPHSSPRSADLPRVLLIAEHASYRSEGESALPLRYFQSLLERNIPVWLITHERVRSELISLLPHAANRMLFVPDTLIQRWMWALSQQLPTWVSSYTTRLILSLLTQLAQKRLAQQLIVQCGIQIIHQPTPTSPYFPSLIFGLNIPVVMGPMHVSVDRPPGFDSVRERWLAKLSGLRDIGVQLANRISPGKRHAAALLVSNERTRQALPVEPHSQSVTVLRTGLDLSIWHPQPSVSSPLLAHAVPTFVFVGRLTECKAVDLLLYAFDQSSRKTPMSLTIVGDGPQSQALRNLAQHQGRLGLREGEAGKVFFAGWQSQTTCASILQRSHSLVQPGLREGQGSAMLEALACGLPVIATAWGVALDHLDHECAVLIPPTTRPELIDRLAQAMRTLASDSALRRRMGTAGQAKVRRDFDWQQTLHSTLDLYRRLIGQRAA